MAPKLSLGETSVTSNPLHKIGNLKVEQLRTRLNKRKVPYQGKALKPELLALCCLETLNLLEEGNCVEEDLLSTITEWCHKSVKELLIDLDESGLSKEGNRWDHIRDLILHKVQVVKEEMETENAETTADDTSQQIDSDADDELLDENQANNDSKEIMSLENIDPILLNFLLHTVYTEIERSRNMDLLPGCPVNTVEDAQDIMDELPILETAKDIAKLSEKHQTLLNWVVETFGEMFELASGDMEIPGQDESVTQFVIVKPEPEIQVAFEEEKTKESGESMLLFHGTRALNLLAILKRGFIPSEDIRYGEGLFMAESPGHSYFYANGQNYLPQAPTLPFSPFANCGILLGCEVAGNGRPVDDEEAEDVHVITRLRSIIPRHVFVVPQDEMEKGIPVDYGYPQRPKMESAMKKAFKKIEKGIASQSK